MGPDRWHRVEELFHAATAMPGGDVGAFLDLECGADAALRLEVESLLQSHRGEGNLLDKTVADVAAGLFEARPSGALSGTELGHYELRELLGAGGMGEVYRAWDTVLARTAAIKVLGGRLQEEPNGQGAFLREARAAAAVNHPNVATVYEIGQSGGVSFIAMEFVEGGSLAARIREHPLSLAEILELGAQVADALAAAHSRGIVHRDIKPGNIMLGPDGQAKVVDFGLAKAIPGAMPPGGDRTRTGQGLVMGTVRFMSPEQLLGERLDGRSDLFGLGAVLFEMATGRPAFPGHTQAETVARILSENPASEAMKDPALPAALAHPVDRCLRRNREHRYGSAAELAVDLRALRSGGTPLRAAPGRRGWLWAAGAAAAAVVAGAPFMWRRNGAGPPLIESLAVLPLNDLSGGSGQEYFAEGMTEELTNGLGQVRGLRVISRTSAMHYKGSRLPIPEIARRLGADALLEGSVMRAGDRVRITLQLIHASTDSQLWARSYDRALGDVLALRSAVAQAVAQEVRLQMTPGSEGASAWVHPAAYEAYLRGRYLWNRRTGDDLHDAIRQFEKAIEITPGYAAAYVGLADCFNLLTPYAGVPAEEAYPKSKAAALRALELDPGSSEANSSLAVVEHEFEWEHRRAEMHFRRSIETNPSHAPSRQLYAEFLARSRRNDEAIAEIRQARALDPGSNIVAAIVGWVLTFGGRHDEAISELQKLVAQEPRFVPARGYLCMALTAKGEYPRAVEQAEAALALSRRQPRYVAQWGIAQALRGQRNLGAGAAREIEAARARTAVPAYLLAALHRALRSETECWKWLDAAVRERGVWTLFLNIDPLFEPMREAPRFRTQLARIGYPAV